MTQPVRMVLDTNVVLSALVFGGGLAGQARRAWQDGLLVPLASRATVQKLVRVVAYPRFRLSGAEQGELLVDFLSCAATVRIPQPPPLVPECRDPLDVPFLQLAVAGKAQVLVSGDKDLLVLSDEFKQAWGCLIVTMDVFQNQIGIG